MKKLIINGADLTLEDILEVSRGYRQVELAPVLKDIVEKREKESVQGEGKFPAHNGQGAYSNLELSTMDAKRMQVNMLRALASDFPGEMLHTDQARAAVLLKLNELVSQSVQRPIQDALLYMLNRKITPLISASSFPLNLEKGHAQLALTLIAEGFVDFESKKVKTEFVLHRSALEKLKLEPGDAVKLIEGQSLAKAVISLLLIDIETILMHLPYFLALHIEVQKIEPKDKLINLLEGSGIISKFRKEGSLSFIEESKRGELAMKEALQYSRKNIDQNQDCSLLSSSLLLLARQSVQRLENLLNLDSFELPQGLIRDEASIGLNPLLVLARESLVKMESSENIIIQHRAFLQLLSLELLALFQAFSLIRPLKSSEKIEAFYSAIRHYLRPYKKDQNYSEDLLELMSLISSGQLVNKG